MKTAPVAFLLLVATTAVMAQSTPANVSTSPYTCAFETDNSAAAWSFANNATNAWHIGQAVAKDGIKSLYISNDNGTNNSYTTECADFSNLSYAYTTLNIATAGEYIFEFDWRCIGEVVEYNLSSGYYRYDKDYLQLYLVPANTAITAIMAPTDEWTSLSDPLDGKVTWQHFATTRQFGQAETGLYNLVFCWRNDNSSGSQPPAAVDNVAVRLSTCPSPTAFTVTAIDEHSASIAWEAGDATVGEYAIYLDGEYYDYTTQLYYDFSGLLSNHYYTVNVRSACNDENTSLPLAGGFRTQCSGLMDLPFTEDWEHVGGTPSGIWPDCWDSTLRHSTSTAVHTSYNNTPDGRYSMRLVASNDSNLMVSAQLPLSSDGITVAFAAMLQAGAGTSSLQAGTMTDPTDPASFQPLLTVTNADGQWRDYEFTIDAQSPSHVAFLFCSTGGLRQAAIDDILIFQTPQCATPTMLVADTTGPDMARLRWTSTGSDGYQIAYSTADSLDEATTTFISIAYGDTVAVLDDLAPLTAYHAWVRSVCGSDYSPWRAAAPFHTTCADASCELEVVLNGEAFSSYHASLNILQADITMANCTESGTVRVCSSAPVAITYNGAIYGAYDALASVTVIDGGGDTLITTTGTSINYAQSLGMPCPSCIIPVGIAAIEVSQQSATIAWEPVEGAEGYAVALGGIHNEVLTENSILIEDLQPGQEYHIAVQTICGDGDTSAAREVVFTTLCTDMPVSYSTGFDYMAVNHAPACWNQVTTYGVQPTFPCVMGGGIGGSQALRFVGYASWNYLTTPAIPIQGDQIEVSFMARIHGTGSSLTAGVCTIPDDTSTFIPLVTVNAGDAFVSYSFTTDTLDPQVAYHVAFKYYGQDNSQYADVDNLRIRLDDGCLAPTSLDVSATDSVSISLEWEVDEQWPYLVLQHRPIGGNWSEPLDVSGYIDQTIEDLQPDSRYEVRVGTVCTTDTLWTTITARTNCGTMPIPYTEDWEAMALGSWPTCWTTTATSSNLAISSSRNHTIDGNRSLVCIGNGDTVMVATTRPIPLAGDNITVNLWASLDNSASWLEAGVVTDPSDPSTFVPLTTARATDASQEHRFSTTGLDSSASYYLGLLIYATAQDTVAVDDIVVMPTPECTAPWETTVGTVTATTAVLNWEDLGASGYEVAYSMTNNPATATIVNATGTTANLTGLAPRTLYYVWVRTLCGNDHSPWHAIAPFTTLCDIDPCQLTVRCHDNPGDGWDGDAALSLHQNNVTLATVTMATGQNLNVSVDGICNSIPLVLVWHRGEYDQEISFEVYNAADNMIAQVLDAQALADNQPFDTIDTPCTHSTVEPTDECLPPSTIDVDGISHNGAIVSWLPGRQSDNTWELTLNGVTRTITERPYVLHDLTPLTDYTLSIATVCGENRSSAVSTTFTTTAADGIDDAETFLSSIYPNPAAGSVTITLACPSDIVVIDLCGREALRTSLPAGANQVDISSLAVGTYFLRVVNADSNTTHRLIVQ